MRNWLMILGLALSLSLAFGCKEEEHQQAADAVKDAAKQTEDAAKDGAAKTGEAVKEATDAAKDAAGH